MSFREWFEVSFKKLTENAPFPWQTALFEKFVEGNFPASCNLPTGLGKTSVLAIWLLAFKKNPAAVPRRLVYVVNRRTVVDQTTNEAENLKRNCSKVGIPELAISTLRGQFADNREWSADPSRPAIICGTVDMIGSRLLFSGYGVGFKAKPLHAGFLGQDVLLVHDEAHLEPAFQELLVAIQKEQERCKEFGKFHVVELSATSRADNEAFTLTVEDHGNAVVNRRINAKKTVRMHPLKDVRKLAEQIAELALKHRDAKSTVIVFARTVDDVMKIREKLAKEKLDVETLTGTMRGLERDSLIEKEIFKRFLPGAAVGDKAAFLVCTAAGEVGVNISADHLVCDLSTFESIAQRFGRVNRFGDREDTQIDIVHPTEFEDEEFENRRERTLAILLKLQGDGSPKALAALPLSERIAAFAPPPTILPTSDILFDAWALTTIKEKMPGRPPVEPFLHGVSEYDPPQTTVAWREEVELLTPEILTFNNLDPDDILDLYPLKPHEELSGPTNGKNKVFEQLEAIAERDSKRPPVEQLSAWVVDGDGSIRIISLQKLVERDKLNKPLWMLGGRTVILPPKAGGLSGGFLDGEAEHLMTTLYDVADQWFTDKERKQPRRTRVWELDKKPREMRLIRRIDIPAPEDDEDVESKSWYWCTRPKSADDDGSKMADTPVSWDAHTSDVVKDASRLADALLRDRPELHRALILAARYHDCGKKRIAWQKGIGNPNPTDWHAKSGKGWRANEIIDYRHEFGSVFDALQEADFAKLGNEPDLQALVLHLIATHHGYGRPHFPAKYAYDPEHGDTDFIADEVPRRFAILQRKFGRWGLAYLESLLRAADWAASAKP